ncbi:MAG: hypothetical protein AAE987_07545 [Thermoplasmataceae archaeon]
MFEEFQPVSLSNDPPWNRIRRDILRSKATFVVLSEPLENINYRHTMNWIDFEVGLSCAWLKPVWVFEPMENQINFSVPYATHQMYYEFQSDDRIKWLVVVLRRGEINWNCVTVILLGPTVIFLFFK